MKMKQLMITRLAVLAVPALAWCACGAHSSQLPAVNLRLYETPPQAAPSQRLDENFTLSATLIDHARIGYRTPAELLKAAETSAGEGSPQKLLQAGRSLVAGPGVTLVGTVRTDTSGGSAQHLAQFLLALSCAPANLDEPGDLKDCQGYLLRVTQRWPAEVYAIDQSTVTLIPDGGTARGRLRARSVPGAFKAEFEGEFTATLLDLQPTGGLAAERD